MHHAHHIDIESPAPVLERVFPNGSMPPTWHDTGVVAQQMDGSKPRVGLFGQLVHAGRLCHIGNHRQRHMAGGGERAAHPIGRGRVDVGDDDLHAGTREAPTQCFADSTAATCHHGYPAIELAHFPPRQ